MLFRMMIGIVAAFSCVGTTHAAELPREIRVWPSVASGSERSTDAEQHQLMEFEKGSGKKYEVISNVSIPTLAVFPPDQATDNGTAVIICPGGAWLGLAWEFEGTELARWLAKRGVTAFVLKYRTRPTQPEDLVATDEGRKLVAVMQTDIAAYRRLVRAYADFGAADGKEAIKIVRKRANEFGIKPDRIGMIGFSAGGDIVTQAALSNNQAERPNFAALIYGVYLNDKPLPQDASPAFLAVGAQDALFVPLLQKALADWTGADRSVEFHLFSNGGHGFGMRTMNQSTDQWIRLFEKWLKNLGWIETGDGNAS